MFKAPRVGYLGSMPDPTSLKSGEAKGAVVFALIIWVGGIALNLWAGNPAVNVLTAAWTFMCIGLAFKCVETSNASHIEIRGDKTTLHYWDENQDPPRRFRY